MRTLEVKLTDKEWAYCQEIGKLVFNTDKELNRTDVNSVHNHGTIEDDQINIGARYAFCKGYGLPFKFKLIDYHCASLKEEVGLLYGCRIKVRRENWYDYNLCKSDEKKNAKFVLCYLKLNNIFIFDGWIDAEQAWALKEIKPGVGLCCDRGNLERMDTLVIKNV